MRKKLTLYIFLIAALAVALSSAVGMWTFRRQELAAARLSLTELLAFLDVQGQEADVDGLLEQFSRAAPDKRLTIIDPNGVVLGDTDADPSDDHSGRPEVEAALSTGSGEDVRRSATTGVITLYVARTFPDGTIGRAAMPLASVNALMMQTAAGVAVAAAAALVLALLLARRLASTAARPVEEAEAAVQQMDETLQNARSEFTANVTHELKTPLTSIKGFTDMMASGLVKDEEDRKRFLAMISLEADRLTRLVDDILKVSELETAAGVSGTERAELLSVAGDVCRMLAPAAEQARVTLTVTGSETVGAISPERFKEVALNLIENAVKYNKTGGRVMAAVAEEGGKAVFTVADTGIGIPPESQGRVFERFYRVDKGRSRAAGGTGLGLAIVKHIVALYDGEVRLSSVVGSGTTVTVTLPLTQK